MAKAKSRTKKEFKDVRIEHVLLYAALRPLLTTPTFAEFMTAAKDLPLAAPLFGLQTWGESAVLPETLAAAMVGALPEPEQAADAVPTQATLPGLQSSGDLDVADAIHTAAVAADPALPPVPARPVPAAAAVAAAASDVQTVPFVTVDQRVTYSPRDGVRHVGTVTAITGTVATFLTDGGEEFTNVGLQYLVPLETAPESDDEVPIFTIPAADYDLAVELLTLTAPAKTPPDSDGILVQLGTVNFDGLYMAANVINSDQGPYVDFYLENEKGDVVAEGVPQETRSLDKPLSIQYDEQLFEYRVARGA